jgi:hypothetical protein
MLPRCRAGMMQTGSHGTAADIARHDQHFLPRLLDQASNHECCSYPEGPMYGLAALPHAWHCWR